MRILVVSNFYPPHYIGGYELGCRDVVEGLKERGHDVRVLTSTYGVAQPVQEGEIYRWLDYDAEGAAEISLQYLRRLRRKEITSRKAFEQLCNSFRPDVVYFWNAAHISIALALLAQKAKLPVCFFISDDWLSRWENDSAYWLWNHKPRSITRRTAWVLLRMLLSFPNGPTYSDKLDLRHVQFCSEYLKRFTLESGKPVADAKVIHWGVDVNRFPYKELEAPRRLLFVGQVVPHKGTHTVIQAAEKLAQRHAPGSFTLTVMGKAMNCSCDTCRQWWRQISGGEMENDYAAYLQRLVSSANLGELISFTGMVSRDQLPSRYRQHDILIFPSIWEEPFAITPLEAMSSGLAVVATPTGGSAELMSHETNGLVFPRGDATACAEQVSRLMESPEFYEKLRLAARKILEEKFQIGKTIDSIEQALKEAVSSASSTRAGE